MKKLISMTDYVLEQRNNKDTDNIRRFWACERYAHFLKLPLTLGMFIPTDENGNVLECPHHYGLLNSYPTGDILMDLSFSDAIQFQQAKNRVIFEGFELDYDSIVKNSEIRIWFYKDLVYLNSTIIQLKTIEDLVKYNLTINETAVKKYGL